MTAPAFGVTDVLNLGTGWEPQSNSPSSGYTRATAVGDDGDIVAEVGHHAVENGTATYIYTGESTDFPAALAAAGADVGDLVDTNTLQIIGWSIDYSPCAAGKRPTITFTYRDGPTADPATPYVYISALDAALPTYYAANVIVPPILTSTAGTAEIQTSTCALMAQFGEDLDKDGEYLSSNIYGAEETITTQWVGTPTSVTSTGYVVTSSVASNTGEEANNTGYGTSSYTYVKGITRT